MGFFGNRGRLSKSEKANKLNKNYLPKNGEIVENKIVYIGDCINLKNAVFKNCKIFIEESAKVRNCTFEGCVVERGVYSLKRFDKSLSKNKRNTFLNCISLNAKPYEVGLDANLLDACFGDLGRKLRKAAYEADFPTIKCLIQKLDLDRKYLAHRELVENNDDCYRLSNDNNRKKILREL